MTATPTEQASPPVVGATLDMLEYTIEQQDGTKVVMRCPTTVHNRQFVDFVARHEPHMRFAEPPRAALSRAGAL